MKKALFIPLVVALALSSCQEENPIEPGKVEMNKEDAIGIDKHEPSVSRSSACSCSDDAEIEVRYDVISCIGCSTYIYEVSWRETPSRSGVQLGYTTNDGRDFVVKNNFSPCENGCGRFFGPGFGNSPGSLARIWLRVNTRPYRYCNGWVVPAAMTFGTFNGCPEIH